jgi:hypothetical protein
VPGVLLLGMTAGGSAALQQMLLLLLLLLLQNSWLEGSACAISATAMQFCSRCCC